jgi:hypothetical protein
MTSTVTSGFSEQPGDRPACALRPHPRSELGDPEYFRVAKKWAILVAHQAGMAREKTAVRFDNYQRLRLESANQITLVYQLTHR